MHNFDELKDMLVDKLDEYAEEGKLTISTLDTIHKLTDTVKNLCKIDMLEEAAEYTDNEYSRRYGRGASYARKRDNMGRYSRESYRRGYSRDDAREHMIDQIEDMMQNASTDKEREALRKCMTVLQNV